MGTRQALDQVGEEHLAAGIEPVEVLDQDHRPVDLSPHLDHAPDGGKQLTLPCLRIGRRRTFGIGDTEEVKQHR